MHKCDNNFAMWILNDFHRKMSIKTGFEKRMKHEELPRCGQVNVAWFYGLKI